MSNVNLFEVAAKNKFRFQFKGQLHVEDLFDLTVEELDSVYKVLNSQLKVVQEESLLNTKTPQDKELDAKIEIVKYIFNLKLEERNAKQKAKEKAEKKQKLMALIAQKEAQELEGKSKEDLLKELAELESE
jgi:hypothetical protein